MRFLFVDRIVALSPGEWIRGVKHITRDDSFLTNYEPGKTAFVSSLVGETLGQLAAWNVMQHCNFTLRPVAGVVASARVYRPAYLGETLLLESYIDALDERAVHYHSEARVGDELIFSIEGALGPMLPMNEFIDSDTIRQQFTEIYRPGDWAGVQLESTTTNTAPQLEGGLGAVAAPMLFDKILSCEPGVSLTAEKKITAAAPYFVDHFPNKPVLPLTVLLECKLNLALEFVGRSGLSKTYQVQEFRKIKMSDFVQPGDTLLCYVKVKQQTDNELVLSYRSEVAGKRVCVVDVVMVAKGK